MARPIVPVAPSTSTRCGFRVCCRHHCHELRCRIHLYSAAAKGATEAAYLFEGACSCNARSACRFRSSMTCRETFQRLPSAPRWELLSDRVMGGVSSGRLSRETVSGRPAIRMQGDVSLANNGGFIQMALDLDPAGGAVDCRGSCGHRGRGCREWRELWPASPHIGSDAALAVLPAVLRGRRRTGRPSGFAFSGFGPHRTELPLDLARMPQARARRHRAGLHGRPRARGDPLLLRQVRRPAPAGSDGPGPCA